MTSSRVADAAETWRNEGWALVPGLIAAEDIDAALPDLWQLFQTPDEFHGGRRDRRREAYFAVRDASLAFLPADAKGPGFRAEQLLGLRPFPFPGSGRLNRLAVHPALLGFVRAAMQQDDIRLYLAEAWAKYAGVANYEQPMHRDANHALLPPRNAPGWWHMEGFLYLNDVEEGATRLVPNSRAMAGTGRPDPAMPDEAPDLYASEVAAPGPRGSYLCYRPDVWHRAVDLTRPGSARFVLALGFKPAGLEWVGYTSLPTKTPDFHFKQFVAGSTPDELAVLGFPAPGHAYWTAETVAALGLIYPGLDVAPWRAGLAGS